MIGIWAFEEVSLKNKSTFGGKLGAFLLAFIPLAAIYSSLHAARTVIRKDRVSILSIASIASVIMMTLVLFRTSDQIRSLAAGIDLSNLSAATTLLPDIAGNSDGAEEGGAGQSQTPTTGPTDTPKPYINGCRNPRSVTADEEGEYLELCGEVTNFGVKDCKNCPLGYYSYLKLDGKFQIVSYEWRFTHAWLKKCVKIEDTLQLLGGIPAFVFNTGEGCIGDCVHDFHGGLIDDGGAYFQPFDGCD
jgi:hypothetical protein